jgi:hypothetical protein
VLYCHFRAEWRSLLLIQSAKAWGNEGTNYCALCGQLQPYIDPVIPHCSAFYGRLCSTMLSFYALQSLSFYEGLSVPNSLHFSALVEPAYAAQDLLFQRHVNFGLPKNTNIFFFFSFAGECGCRNVPGG